MSLYSKTLMALLLSCSIAFPTLANWTLNNAESSLSFISIKKDEIAEAHHFERLSGAIDSNGQASLSIDLTSVNTSIAIRDQRMRDFLFETTKFAQASFSTQVDLAFINAMKTGEQKQITISGEMSLHGQS